MNLAACPGDKLVEYIAEGHREITKLRRLGGPVPETWEKTLAELEIELARRRTVEEITRLMQEHGWAIVWSDILGEAIAFAQDDQAAAQVPGGIIAYTRAELEAVLGKGHDPDMLRLVHEAKKLGARIASRDKANG